MERSLAYFAFMAVLAFGVSFCISDRYQSFPLMVSTESENPGFRLKVDYGNHIEIYHFPTDRMQIDLLDLLSEFSVRENPPMRFITTLSTIEIYDVYGIRNNFQNGWSLYVDRKKIRPEELKRGMAVERDSEILLRYEKVQRFPVRDR